VSEGIKTFCGALPVGSSIKYSIRSFLFNIG
jgi:hypothetical protein